MTLNNGETDEEWARRLQEEYDQEVVQKEANEIFPCPICLEISRLDCGVELDCLHRICRECVIGYLRGKIAEKQVADGELRCPMPSCKCELTVPQIEGAMKGSPEWERFLSCRAELWRPTDGEPDRMTQCPNLKCRGYQFLVPRKTVEVACPRCSQIFCSRCQESHKGITCQAFLEAGRKEIDKDLEDMIRRERWQRCPSCGSVCERQHGCNFMTCSSEKCRGSVSFCYLCGTGLTTTEHITHFPHGLFQNACTKVDLRDDGSMPRATWGSADWWSAVARDVKTLITG